MPFITQGKTNLTYILIVVILAVIVGGGILGYYYSWIKELETKLAEIELKLPAVKQPGDETANWKTYESREGNYIIKYPKDWNYLVYEDEMYAPEAKIIEGVAFGPYEKWAIAEGGGAAKIEVSRRPFEEKLELLRKWLSESTKQAVTETKETPITIDKVSGINIISKTTFPDGNTTEHSQVLVSKNQRLYYFTGLTLDSRFPENAKFNQMLSTFKFLE